LKKKKKEKTTKPQRLVLFVHILSLK